MAQKLFDKASLVNIPSQYKDGKLYNIKPEDQSSSFEFQRGSAATRVNEDGLIEYAGLGDELVVNGDFSDGLTGWLISLGTPVVLDGKLTLPNNARVRQNLDLILTNEYLGSIEVSGLTQGYIDFYIGSSEKISISSNGVHNFFVSDPTVATIYIYAYNNFDGAIDNVSVKQASNNTPRIDYSTGEAALLLEPQRSNLLVNSVVGEGLTFISTNTTLQLTTETKDPFGGYNARRFTTQNLYGYTNKPSVSRAVAGDYTASLFVKGINGLSSSGSFVFGRGVGFDISSSGVVTTKNPIGYGAATNYKSEHIRDGWYKISFTWDYGIGQDGMVVASDVEISDFYVYAVQFEQGSYPTSYIPTYGTIETRNADICIGGGDASVFNDSEGTLFLDYQCDATDKTYIMSTITNDAKSQRVQLYISQSGTPTILVSDGPNTNLIDIGSTNSGFGSHKIGLRYSPSTLDGYFDSTKYSTTNSTTLSGLSNLKMSYFNSDTVFNFDGRIKSLHYFPEALSDGYMQILTSNANITAADSEKFIITVKTDNAGTSLSNQFTLPWIGTDYSIETSAGHAISGLSGSYTLSFPEAGTYDVAVTAASGSIRFANGGDKAKLLDIKNWGAVQWTSLSEAFRGCSNTVITAVDTPDLSIATSIFAAFLSTSSITSVDVSKWNVSGITDFGNLFRDSALTSIDVSNWDTSSATIMSSMFRGLINLKADFAGLDINSVTTFNDFASNTNINETGTTTNYDNTLISWAAQTPQNNIVINFGTAKYSWRAIEARNTLVNTYNWTITDGGIADDAEFVITVRTTTSAETFTIPTTGGGYNYNVNWGDGTSTVGETGNATHEYASAGDYDIQITGTFPRIYFNNTGDKAKLIDIKNWGNGAWTDLSYAFWGCSELTAVSAEDAPNLNSVNSFILSFGNCTKMSSLNVRDWDVSNISIFNNAFQSCSVLIDLDVSLWNTSGATSLSQTFNGATLLNPDVTNWDTSSITNMFRTFRITSLDRDLSGFDIINVTNLTDFATGVTLSTANYDATLIGWEANLQATYPAGAGYTASININFGGSQYTLGSAAETARTSLRNTFGWTITDGGGVSGVLNQYTGAAAAYSLRNLSTATTSVVRVRRDSDNAEQDFTYDGIMDVGATGLASWVGAGNNGYVVTWYDQSGLGNHLTQGTASAQPQIVASGVVNLVNGMPAILSDGVDDILSLAFSATNPTTQFFVYDKVGTSGNLGGLYNGTSLAPALALNPTGVSGYQQGPQLTPIYANNNQAVVSLKSSTTGTDWAMWGNGTSITNSGENIGTAAPNNITLMARGYGSAFSNAYFQEYIVYPSDQTSNQSAIESNINDYYNIYP